MRVRLPGTRGSIFAPQLGGTRYGANTSCVEVRPPDGSLVILDAGTGIRSVEEPEEPLRRVDILITHLHMDHIVGLPFFWALFRPGLDVHVWGPPSPVESLDSRLGRYLSPPLFPVRLRDLPCRFHFHDAPRGRFELPGVTVDADFVSHPGTTLGFRLEAGGASVAYIPDHEPALGVPPGRFPLPPRWTSGFSLLEGVDLAIHDAQYTEAEYQARRGWGHCTLAHTLALAEMAGVRHLVPFHHDPEHDDAQLDAMFAAARAGGLPFRFTPAADGIVFDVAPCDEVLAGAFGQ